MTEYRPLIESIAAAHSLDPNLVEAIVIQESNACTDAFRYEDGFYRRYLKGHARFAGQIPRRISSSYGLMQVMYTTAQEYGFHDVPEVLFVPDQGLQFGCLHLKHLLQWAGADTRKALASYNGGEGNWQAVKPQRYASQVLMLKASVEAAHAR